MPSRSGINANFGNFSRDIQRMSDSFTKEVKELVEDTLGDIEMNSIRDAPAGGDMISTEHGPESQGEIKRGRPWVAINQAIGYSLKPDGFSGDVFVEESAGEVAAWVEFSTGQSATRYLATVPDPWRAAAAKFIRTGDGTILGKPYFLPNVLKQEILYKKEMKELLKRQRP